MVPATRVAGMNRVTTRPEPGGAPAQRWMLTLAASSGVVLLFVFLAFDGRLHWDEVGYLYTGGFLDREAILRGEFLGGIYISRLLHIAVIAAIVNLVGPGGRALALLTGLYTAALLLVSRLSYSILRKVLPDARGLGLAVVCGMFAPIYLYLAFKTMPEIPALAMSAIATWALLRAFTGRPLIWLPVVGLALLATVFLKAEMTLLYVSFVMTVLLFGLDKVPRPKLLGYVVLSGIGSLAVFGVVLWALGIDLGSYLGVGAALLDREEPLAAKILNITLEGGIFFAALPLAFLSGRRREAGFFLTWFLFASLPLPLLFTYVEPRYLAPNLVPLTGSIYLTMHALTPRVAGWWHRSKTAAACAVGLVLLILLGSNLITLPLMPHEVRKDQLRRLVARLDQAYAGRRYAILTPYTYTDFHYLRFVYPDRPIYTVQTSFNRSSDNWSYYPGRVVTDLDQLSSIDAELVYLGFHENLAAENLRRIVQMVPIPILARQLEKMEFQDHLALSWMWDNPALVFGEPVREGHYFAYPVRVGSSEP